MRRLASARWAVLGAAAPDLPALGAGTVLVARGVPRARLLDAVYHSRGLRAVHLGAHALVAPAGVAALLGRRSPAGRALAAGWLGHLLVDYATHSRDAWPPLWPFSRRRFASPVSYWEPDSHAQAYSLTETAALLCAAATERGAAGRLAALAAAGLASGPAAAGAGRSVWSALGARPDVYWRARDLRRDRALS